MVNALYVIIMDMLQPTVEAKSFSHNQIDTTQKDLRLPGTQVFLRDIVFHAAILVIKQLIAIEERIEKHIMIPMLTFLVT